MDTSHRRPSLAGRASRRLLACLLVASLSLPLVAAPVAVPDPGDSREVAAFADSFFADALRDYRIPGAALVLV